MTRPRLLDLFCNEGGATRGYQQAGFHVTGVDIEPQPNYIGDEFIQADAMTFPLDGYQVVHASPPCQLYTRAGHLRDAQGGTSDAEDLLVPTLERLAGLDGIWVVENVEWAPFPPSVFTTLLCGSSFGLQVRRHRLFGSNVLLMRARCEHARQGRPVGVYHRMGDAIPHGGTTAVDLEEAQQAMGIDWMTWSELKEAIPPAYTRYIGEQPGPTSAPPHDPAHPGAQEPAPHPHPRPVASRRDLADTRPPDLERHRVPRCR